MMNPTNMKDGALRVADDEILCVGLRGGGEIVLTKREAPKTRENQIEIAPQFSYISAGTELLMLEEYAGRPRGEGEPVPMGYSLCGVVSAAGMCGEYRIGEAVPGGEHAGGGKKQGLGLAWKRRVRSRGWNWWKEARRGGGCVCWGRLGWARSFCPGDTRSRSSPIWW